MNKISKKILAIVTMVAFVVTMMPFAAFAAPADNTPSVETSVYKTVKEDVEVAKNEAVETTFEISNVGGEAVDTVELENVYVWATEKGSSVPTAAATFKNAEGGTLDAGKIDNVYYSKQNTMNEKKLTVSFSRTGEFVLHAAVIKDDVTDLKDAVELKYLDGYNTVNVVSGKVDGIKIDSAVATQNPKDDTQWTVNEDIFANGTEKNTVTVTAYTATGEVEEAIAVGKEFTVTSNSGNLDIVSDSPVTTDRRGQFKVTYTASKAGTYYIDLDSEDGYTAQLIVTATSNEKVYPASIETTVDNEATLNVDNIEKDTTLANAVQFEIKDQNGEVMTGKSAIKAEPATGNTNKGDVADYVSLTAPEKFKGDDTDFLLVWDKEKEVYTLQYVGEKADLVAGEYTVRVSLYNTGNYADATFTLGEFDAKNVTEMKIVPDKEKVEYNAKSFGYDVIVVDKNGVEDDITADNTYSIGVTSVAGVNTDASAKGTVAFTVKDKDAAIGSKIVLTAASEKYKKVVTAEVTLTDVGVAAGLAFDVDNGEANKDNTVKVSVVDENGEVVTSAKGDIMAYVADKSNEKANVQVTPGKAVKNGENGTLTIFADQETTIDVVVAVVDSKTNKIYADTLEYTVGAEDVNADTIVAMTIGSSDIIVNNDIVSGDAAPFVDSNWRTMVPVRALSEAFGGTAEWDGDARTVTVVNGDITIVFDADSDKYTVNDVEKTMDTELTIIDGRTYVPVKFVAEELGYKVTALKDAAGLTAGVVFQK